jgi:cell division protein FtsA
MLEIAEDIFQMPVRLGTPVYADGNGRQIGLTEGGFASVIQDPKFATGVGLVLHGARHEPVEQLIDTSANRDRGAAPGKASLPRRWMERVREMF